jgi:ribosomal protein L9
MQTSTRRWGHTVRLIALEDLPHNKGYGKDVIRVKAGYARNFLIPKKKAVYATPQNFEKLGIVDPDVETEEQRTERLQRESSMNQKEELYLKEADLLKKYLRNKVVSS